MNICFLDGGDMAAVITSGLVRQGGHRVHITNRGKEKRECSAKKLGVSVFGELLKPIANDVLISTVKPQDIRAACQGVQTNDALVLFVTAGLSIATLSRYLGGARHIVRVMPNMSGKIGLEVSGMFAGDSISDQDKTATDSIMHAAGITVWLDDEERLYDITGINGSGSAYVFYLPDVLKQAARQQGFGEKEAHRLSLVISKGAIALAGQTGESFTALQQNVTFKGGTTHEAIETFKARQVAETVAKGMTAYVNRSRELARQFKTV